MESYARLDFIAYMFKQEDGCCSALHWLTSKPCRMPRHRDSRWKAKALAKACNMRLPTCLMRNSWHRENAHKRHMCGYRRFEACHPGGDRVPGRLAPSPVRLQVRRFAGLARPCEGHLSPEPHGKICTPK
eukprot:3326759-Amphidinium_carterae.2